METTGALGKKKSGWARTRGRLGEKAANVVFDAADGEEIHRPLKQIT